MQRGRSPIQGKDPHPLLGQFDIDPGAWRPLWYKVEIDVGINAGDVGRGSITLYAQPFVLTRVAHKIIGNTADPETSGLYQDGQYDLLMRDEQSNYTDDPIAADLMCGSYGANVGGAAFLELPFPIPYAGNKTITFEVTNRVDRVLVPESTTFPVQIVVGGLSDWGELKPGERR